MFQFNSRWSQCQSLDPRQFMLTVLACGLILFAMQDATYAASTYAVIGDYGADAHSTDNAARELAVADMVKSWSPDFIVTTGDNNYDNGEAATMERNVGKYYYEFIGGYIGPSGIGPVTNRFFPTPGNHDWDSSASPVRLQPYLDFFDLPGTGFVNTSGNQRYYDFTIGDMHFFALDSDSAEKDGRELGSDQINWLHNQLAVSTSKWNFVVLHHAPYSSGSTHGGTAETQYPYQQWGVDAVFAGHDHHMERIVFEGFPDLEKVPYFVSGAGGRTPRAVDAPMNFSQFSNGTDNGALKVTVDGDLATFEFYSVNGGGGTLLDTYTVDKNAVDSEPQPIWKTFQQDVDGYTGTRDTFVQQDDPTADNGAAIELNVDNNDPQGSGLDVQALLQFDNIFGDGPGQVALDAPIAFARLEIQGSNPGDSIELHRMLGAWDDSATWDSLVNGIQADGSEAAATAESVSGKVGEGFFPIDVTADLLAWQANPDSNFGWALLPTGSNGVDFYSSETTDAPRLVVALQIPEPSSIALLLGAVGCVLWAFGRR